MNKGQQINFINDLIENVKKDILAKADNIPENWDGTELRLYIKDKFSDVVFSSIKSNRKRISNYKNDVLINNL